MKKKRGSNRTWIGLAVVVVTGLLSILFFSVSRAAIAPTPTPTPEPEPEPTPEPEKLSILLHPYSDGTIVEAANGDLYTVKSYTAGEKEDISIILIFFTAANGKNESVLTQINSQSACSINLRDVSI